jgi:hypothetical protein
VRIGSGKVVEAATSADDSSGAGETLNIILHKIRTIWKEM